MIYDIIIIGCGIAGLNTAYQLLLKNPTYKILLLEKNNYLGGKIKTYRKKINNHNYIFEEGAGRLNTNHKLFLNLIEHFNLSNNLSIIGFAINFKPSKGTKYERDDYKEFVNKSPYEYINKVIKYSKNDSKENMMKYTFIEYCKFVLNDKEIKFILDSFGYYSELVTMNAYNNIKLYDEINPDFKYFHLNPGLDIIIKKLKDGIINKKGKIMLNSNVNNITYDDNIFNIYVDNTVYKSKYCILAIPKPDLINFNILNKIQTKLNSVNYISLCRIYCIFKKKDIWFKDIEKTTTNNKSRFIIPIDKEHGLIMISYTDGKYADYWNNLYLTNKELFMNNLKDNIYKTYNKKIENPIYTKLSYWNSGIGYWKKNKDSCILTNEIIQPYENINLFICGENYSEKQGWIEGALETSHKVINKII